MQHANLWGYSVRILTIDIETSPNLAYVWGLWDQNVAIGQIEESSQVICWAAKWHGKKQIEFMSDHHDGHLAMVTRAHELMCEADAIVSYNGRGFDMKHLRREFLLNNLDPPSPHADIDLLATVKSQFKFPSSKLDYVSQALGIGGKTNHTGFQLWRDCMAGCDVAWRLMRKYNRQDVVLTEALYDRLRPWIKTHPHHGLHDEVTRSTCPNCGGHDLQRRGYAYTTISRYQRFQCLGCGRWCRGRNQDKSMGMRGAA